MHDCLIIEGGGFKTAFTSGVIDAIMSTKYKPFKCVMGISGGSVAASYYLSNQYRYCIQAMRYLAKDDQFANYKRTFSQKGYLDIDYISTIANQKVPFELEKAIKKSKDLDVRFVVTNRTSGKAEYLRPNKKNWIQLVIASSTLPFATKGVHQLEGTDYFDGGWSDPLPVKWAIKQGYKNILVLRTKPEGVTIKQSWADYFGSKYFKSVPPLAKTFESAFIRYNEAVELMKEPPKKVCIDQIAPKNFLKSGTYSYSKATLMRDYRYGLDKGLYFFNNL